MARAWTAEEAETWLLDRELFGMRFGLDRMKRLLTALDQPQRRFESIHVVGSNGKSSTARMTAAILSAHGVRTGAYLSPHLVRFAERIRIAGSDLDDAAFGAAIQRVAAAARAVDRTLAEGDRVTQFEALTAAAFAELAAGGVEVAVIEAGLGGRWDATNVLPSKVQVLTNVGLEHTRYLGPTIADIAREKLAVVQDGATLVVGADLAPDAEAEAVAAAERHGALLVRAPAEPDVPVALPGAFQRRNFALASDAARALLGALDPDALRAAARDVTVPGRMELVDRDPLTIHDGAHNPSGIEALAQALAELRGTPPRRLVAVISILEDKDAAAMLRALLPLCDSAVLTSNPNPRALPPATLQSLAAQLGAQATELQPDPQRAVARARELAGPEGIVVATGSIHLIGGLRRAPGQRASTL